MSEYKNLLIPKLGMMAKSVRLMQDDRLNSQNITAKQAMTLGYIVMQNKHGNVVNQKNIEKEFHLTASTVTSLIEKLEKTGYITRSASKTDSRCNILKPTKEALAFNDEIVKNIELIENSVLEGISFDEKKIFEDVLDKMFGNIIRMKEEYENDTTTCKKC